MASRKEIESSLVLLLFGAIFLLYDLKYPLDQRANPGPGVFPLIVGAALVILAAWLLAQDARKPKAQAAKENDEGTKKSLTPFLQRNRGEAKPLLMIAVFIVYLLMVRWVGFFISTFLFVIFSSKLMGAKGWRKPIALSAGINLFCYFLFVAWIKLSFPRGFLF
jgi:putative tricarboxylic transport membrane protein